MSEARRDRRPGLARALLVGALCAACASNEPRARGDASRDEAAAAEARGEWSSAAEQWYGVYLREGSEALDACVAAVEAFLQAGDPQAANHVVSRALEQHPDDVRLLELQGRALTGLGFRRPAERSLERAVELDPSRRDAWLALARVRMELGHEAKALEPLNRAIELGSDDYEVWRMLARASRAAGDPCAAFVAWRRALERGGQTGTEDLVEAATVYLDASVRRTHPEAARYAIDWLEQALQTDPKCPKALFQLGVLHEEQKRPEVAVEHYRRAIEADPACLMALTNLAILYRSLGDEAGARTMAERALAIETDPTRRRALQRLLESTVASGVGQ